MKSIPVSRILEDNSAYDLQLNLRTPDADLNRIITEYRVQKHGLAFAGFTRYLDQERIQIVGKTESAYLETLSPDDCDHIARNLCQHDIACLIVTSGIEPHPSLLRQTVLHNIPLFTTRHKTATFISRINHLLEDHLTPTTSVHGVLLDVYGVGILLTGASGIGKSECALDLVHRGHRLVADDLVLIRHFPPTSLVGQAHEPIRDHMEVRGLGLINIRDMFGITAVRDQKRLDLVIQLLPWDQYDERNRLNLEQKTHRILGVYLPLLILPVSPGRNLATIIEIAARWHMLVKMGKTPGGELLSHLVERLEKGSP
jgi:HPr kinase/phosphorylase